METYLDNLNIPYTLIGNTLTLDCSTLTTDLINGIDAIRKIITIRAEIIGDRIQYIEDLED